MKVLVVEDDEFVNSMIIHTLKSSGFQVKQALDFKTAFNILKIDEPNVLLTDLDLGSGPNGIDLINHVDTHYPWISIVILSTHRNPHLATFRSQSLPKGLAYVVKSDLVDMANLITIIRESVESPRRTLADIDTSHPKLTIPQAEVLNLIARGLSNFAIAEARGVSIRSAESMIAKLYESLGLANDPTSNQRILATKIWRAGKVSIE